MFAANRCGEYLGSSASHIAQHSRTIVEANGCLKCQHHSLKEGGGSRIEKVTSSSRSGWGTGITFSTSLCWRRAARKGQVAKPGDCCSQTGNCPLIRGSKIDNTTRKDSLVGQRV